MATLIRIANKSQTDTYDLISGTYKLVDGTNVWPLQTASNGRKNIKEQLLLVGDADPSTVLIPSTTDLEKILWKAEQWHSDPFLDESYWLEWNVDGESAKRALIMPEWALSRVIKHGINPLMNQGELNVQRLIFNRHPLNESVAASSASNTGLSSIGGNLTITNDGTWPSRIASITFENNSSAGTYKKIWAGIRPIYEGVSSFEEVWESEDGTIGTDTTVTADTPASGGSTMKCTFATATLAERYTIRASDVLLSGDALQKGKYLILLRYRSSVSSSATYGIQLKLGYDGGANFEEKDEIFVTTADTNYHFVELGTVSFPPGDERNRVATDMLLAQFKFWAERLDGTANLYFDCHIMMPATHSLFLDDCDIDNTGEAVIHYTAEDDDQTQAISFDSGPSIKRQAQASPNNWSIPIGETTGGHLVICAERDDSSIKADTVDVTVSYHNRWLSYRG